MDVAIARKIIAAGAPERDAESLVFERAVAGDAAAFGEIYRAHLPAVHRYLYFRMRDEDEAADLCQEVFVKAFRAIASLRDAERLRPWLFRIAHNSLLNHRRGEAGRTVGEDHLERQACPEDSPEEHAIDRLDLKRILEASRGLSDLQRQVLALRFVSGLSVAETASILGRKPNAIHNLQHHALAGLRRRLGAASELPLEPSR